MNGIDTNVLLRLVLEDDVDQAERVSRLIAEQTSADRIFINHIVLAEFTWVVSRHLKSNRVVIAELIGQLLADTKFEVADQARVESALNSYRTSKADFADCLIAELNAAAGCETTYTFDQSADSLDTFSIVPLEQS
ncbi:MAG: type II toxin-antitoxin system VapC family toxin [Pseudomonadota bacterium]